MNKNVMMQEVHDVLVKHEVSFDSFLAFLSELLEQESRMPQNADIKWLYASCAEHLAHASLDYYASQK